MTTPTNPVADRLPLSLSGRGDNDGNLQPTCEDTISDALAEILK